MRAVLVLLLLGIVGGAQADDSKKAAAAQPIGHLFFDDMCPRSNLCVRFKSWYSEVRPDRAIMVGRLTNEYGDEGDVAWPRSGVSLRRTLLCSARASKGGS